MDLPKAIVMAAVIIALSYFLANLHEAHIVAADGRPVTMVLNKLTGGVVHCYGSNCFPSEVSEEPQAPAEPPPPPEPPAPAAPAPVQP